MSGLRQKLGNSPNVALCESDYMDEHKRSQWSFMAVSNERTAVETVLNSIESKIEELVDARVVDAHKELL